MDARMLGGCLLAGLMGAAGAARAQEEAAIWRGNFIAAERGLMMSPCRSGERLIVADATARRGLDALYRELTQRPGRSIFVELSAEKDGRMLRARSLHRAYAEGPGCREDLDAVVLRANGTEPFWHLDVKKDSVTIRRPGPEAVERFPPARFERRGEEFVLESAAGRSVLRVAVRETVCRDPMSGGYYTYAAIADWDGRRYFGCAYWGDFSRPR